MSTIERIEVREFAYDVENVGLPASAFLPIYAPGSILRQRKYVVSVYSSSGARGDYIPVSGGPSFALPQIRDAARFLIGRSLFMREWFWDTVNAYHARLDRIGFGPLEIAIFDATGKELGVSVSAIIGAMRERIPVYAVTMMGDEEPDGLSSPEAYADFAELCLEQGFRGFKVHGPCGAGVDSEIAILEAVRGRVGSKLELMTNPAPALPTFADALRLGRACDELGVFWIQQPFRGSGIGGYSRLRSALQTPVLITEHVRGLDAKADIAISGGTDLLRADPDLDMGITGTLKTAHLAEALGLDLEVHAAGPAHRHCVGAIRNTNFYESALLHPRLNNPLVPPIYVDGYSDDDTAIVADGEVEVPKGPGLGVEYDWEFIQRHSVEEFVLS